MTPILKVLHPALEWLENTSFLWCFYQGLLEGHNYPKRAITRSRVLEEGQPHASWNLFYHPFNSHSIAPAGFKCICSSLELGVLSDISNKKHQLVTGCENTGIGNFPTRCRRAGEEPCLAGSEALLSPTVGASLLLLAQLCPVIPAAVPCRRSRTAGDNSLCAQHRAQSLHWKWSLGSVEKIVCGHLIKDCIIKLIHTGTLATLILVFLNFRLWKFFCFWSASWFLFFLHLCIVFWPCHPPPPKHPRVSATSSAILLTPTYPHPTGLSLPSPPQRLGMETRVVLVSSFWNHKYLGWNCRE